MNGQTPPRPGGIGQPLPRLGDARLTSGQGQYTDDINEPGQLYAAFVRSPHAHARLRAVDLDAARHAPGVVAVLTGHDYLAAGFKGIQHVPNPADAITPAQPAFQHPLNGAVFNAPHLPLPIDKARHVGEPLVMVVADSAAHARDACELVDIDYDVLDAVVNGDDALAPGAPQLWDGAPGNLCFHVQLGDVAAAKRAFDGAACVVRREFRNSRIVNCQMEPRAAIGLHDTATDSYTLISGSQGAVRQRMGLIVALGVPEERVRVVCPDVGGGFGPRSNLYVEQVAVLWAARHVGRPVKWTGDRSEAFLGDYQGRDAIIRAAMALDAKGRILAIDHEWIGNVGAHTMSYVPMANGSRILTTVYDVPVAALSVKAALSNTVSTGPYRGAGRPEATHVMERLMDLAARELGMDRIELRRRNLVSRTQLPYRSVMGLTYDSGDFAGNMARALEMAEWSGFEARRVASRAQGKLRGIGLANYIESPVGAPRERVEMTVRPDGSIEVIVGTQSTGQGHETTFAQVVGEHLGVPPTSVRLRTGDTKFVSVGGGSHSDRSMRLGGTLLVQASQEIVARGRRVAASLLDVSPDRLVYADGAYADAPQPGARRISLFDVAREMHERGAPDDRALRTLGAIAEFNGRIAAHPTGAAVCELEVDPETGDVALLDYTSVDDVGQPINPLIVEGQVHGGLAQGIGQAFSELHSVDPQSGQVLSGSYMDYGLPRAGDIPKKLRIALTEDPTAGNPLRVKGGGESGITPATAAIFNALADALREVSNDEVAMPATPRVVWSYLRNRGNGPENKHSKETR